MNSVDKNRNRIEEIDIIKALGLILMVMGHSGSPFTHFIYLFHMSIFFIASGFLFNTKASDNISNLKNNLINKFKHIWLPFFVWNLVFSLLHNLFVRMNVYTDNSLFLNYVSGQNKITGMYTATEVLKKITMGLVFCSDEQLAGAFWFLRILFLVVVGYSIVDYFVRLVFHERVLLIQAIISVLLSSFSFFIRKTRILKKIMIVISKNSMNVVVFHFLAMKIITLVVVVYYNLPSFCLAAFPNLYGSRGAWWVAYVILGISVPVLLGVVSKKIKGKVRAVFQERKDDTYAI